MPNRDRQATPAAGHRVASFCTDSPSDIAKLAEALRSGRLVAIPTETVYGLAANALDEAACRRIFEVKGRPLLDPLIVHVFDRRAGERLAHFDPRAGRLADAFWPGPLTMVLPKRDVVPAIVTAGKTSVALRSPAHPAARRLLAAAGIPLAAPSANPFGYISPTTAQHVAESLGDRIPLILDGGPCSIGIESTIVALPPDRPARILRPGSLTRADLAAALGEPVEEAANGPPAAAADAAVEAPGMLARHYSPATPAALFPFGGAPAARAGEAFVFQRRPNKPVDGVDPASLYWLSESGDPAEVARNLYALLRQLDAGGYGRIHIERAPPSSLGDSINDRLRRAATAD